MALQSTDLFVVQSQTDKQLYKLSLNDLQANIEAGSGINFRGKVNLNNPPTGQISPDPATNGDMYLVESDSSTINPGWSMVDSVSAAQKDDRILFIADANQWLLVTGGSDTSGVVVEVIATEPLKVDSSDSTKPIISIDQATTTDEGIVARLALAADVVATNSTPPTDAVVTADLLRTTNKLVNDLQLAPGGVLSVSTDDTGNNGALAITPSTGAVKVEIQTATDALYGVVGLADDDAITNGTAGAANVVDAAQLKAVNDSIPGTGDFGVLSIVEGGAGTVSDALEIQNMAGNVTIGVKESTFAPYDFSSLTDIND